jgi:polyribonucleotide nucleotidyltransferase
MGLIIEDGKYAILSDILGDEDHLGDMDFKVAGTTNGLTACQMDIKVRGLSFEILANALAQGKAGRAHILGEMMKTITAPREDISLYAPRLVKMIIPQDTIGAVIGTGGKVIQEIQRETGTVITIEEIDRQGIVTVSSPNKEKIDAAIAWITGIVRQPEVGEVYTECTVKNVREAGAYVEFLPGKDGWLHISEWDYARIDTMDSVVQVGDKVDVQYLGIDPKNNKHRLSRKALLPKPEGYSERPPRTERSDSGGSGFRNDRGDRGGGGDWRGDRSNRGDRRR